MGHNQRNIYVAGNYIAEQHIGTQILHAEQVYTSPTPQQSVHVAEDAEYEMMDKHFRFITPLCSSKHMVQHVENELRTACYGSAEDLWKKIHEYELIGYLSTANVDAETIYREICEYFGQLSYTDRNFRKYR